MGSNQLALLLCIAFACMRQGCAVLDDENLVALDKCTETAQLTDIQASATNMCDEGSRTYAEFLECAKRAFNDTGQYSFSATVTSSRFSVAEAAAVAKNKFCGPFPIMRKYPATFFRTIQASLIILYENLKKLAATGSMAQIRPKIQESNLLWAEGTIGDHIHMGVSTEVYPKAIGEEFSKLPYSLNTPTAEQMQDARDAARKCLQVPDTSAARANVCDRAIAYRKKGMAKEPILTGRTQLAGFESCVRAQYYSKRKEKEKNEFLVMEAGWQDPPPDHGFLVWQPDSKAESTSQNNSGDGEIIVVDAQYKPEPDANLHVVLAFVTAVTCSYDSGRMRETNTTLDLCDALEKLIPPDDIKFSHDDRITYEMDLCKDLILNAELVAWEMLEYAPWITWTGGADVDVDRDNEEELLLKQALDIGSSWKCLKRGLEAVVKKFFCDYIIGAISVGLATISFGTFYAILPTTDNWQLVVWRYMRCVQLVAVTKARAYQVEQARLGRKAEKIDAFINGLNDASDGLPPDPTGMENLNDPKVKSQYDLNKIEKVVVFIDKWMDKAANSTRIFRWVKRMMLKHRHAMAIFADVCRIIPICANLPFAPWILDTMSGYGETTTEDILDMRKDQSKWKKALKFAFKTIVWFSNFNNKLCDFMWDKVKLMRKILKGSYKSLRAGTFLEDFAREKKELKDDLKRTINDAKNSTKAFKKAVGQHWNEMVQAARNFSIKAKFKAMNTKLKGMFKFGKKHKSLKDVVPTTAEQQDALLAAQEAEDQADDIPVDCEIQLQNGEVKMVCPIAKEKPPKKAEKFKASKLPP